MSDAKTKAATELGQYVTKDIGRVKEAIVDVLQKVVTDEEAKKLGGELIDFFKNVHMESITGEFDLRKVAAVTKEAAKSLAQKSEATLTGSQILDAKEKIIFGLSKIVEGVDAKEKTALLEKAVSKDAIAGLTKKAVQELPEADRNNPDKIKAVGEKIEKGIKGFVDGATGSLVTRTADAMQMNPRTTAIGALVAMVAGVFAFKSGTAKTDEQGQETEKGSFWKKALGALLVVGGIGAAVMAHKGASNAITEQADGVIGKWTAIVKGVAKNQGQNIPGVNLLAR